MPNLAHLGTETAFQVLARVGKLAAAGKDITNLGSGQPAFKTPPHIVEAASPEEAASIGRMLVEERMAACANVLGAITSFYRCEGAVQQGAETVRIAKTRADLADRVTARIKALHSYTCPCTVALPIQGGNLDFLAWIAAETHGSQ